MMLMTHNTLWFGSCYSELHVNLLAEFMLRVLLASAVLKDMSILWLGWFHDLHYILGLRDLAGLPGFGSGRPSCCRRAAQKSCDS